MLHAFFHLRGALGNAALLTEQETAINALLAGTYTDKNIEKLQGYNIYSLRLSRGARLLFTTIKIDERDYLLALEHLPNHEYDKSKFLRSGALDKYLDKQAEAHADAALHFEALDAADLNLNLSNDIEGAALDYCQRQIIQLDTHQAAALSVTLPAIVKGPPGSGKSAIAQIYLSNYILSLRDSGHQGTQTPHILYVTHSEELVDTIKKGWEATPESVMARDAGHHVSFLSYADLVALDSAIPKENFTDKTKYLDWYATYIKKERNITKAASEESFIPDAEILYQEFRICSGYTEAAYKSLSGKRQSLFDKTHREWVVQAFASYQKMIGAAINPDFYVMQQANRFDLVIYDEAQDGSYNQLKAVDQLARNHAVIFCMDTKQRINDMRSSLDFIKSTFHIDSTREIQLKLTHRCSLQVTAMANVISEFQGYLTGGAIEKGASTVISALGKNNEMGGAYLLNPDALASYAWLQAEKSAEFAMVTPEEHLEAARQLFKTNLVYTPEQIKGLEFNEVVTYRLFDHPIFKQVKTRLSELGDKRVASTHRPKAKNGVGHEEFIPYFNALYTALTRARKKLVMCEVRTYQNQALFDTLSENTSQEAFVLAAPMDEENSQENWLNRIRQLIQRKSPLAEATYLSKISDNPSDFYAFEAEVLARTKSNPPRAAADTESELESGSGSESESALLPVVVQDTSKLDVPKVSDVAVKKSNPVNSQLKQSDKAASAEDFIFNLLFEADYFTEDNLILVLSQDKLEHFLFKKGKNKVTLIDFIKQDKERVLCFFRCVLNHSHLLDQVTSQLIEKKWLKTEKRKSQKKKSNKKNLEVIAFEPFEEGLNYLFYFRNRRALINSSSLSGDDGIMPVHLLVLDDDPGMLFWFLSLKMDLNVKTKKGLTAVYLAAERGFYDLVGQLCVSGADLNQTSNGESPVFVAAKNGHDRIVGMLCHYHADANQSNENYETPAFIAAKNGHTKVLRVLKQCEASFDDKNKFGETPAYIAASENRMLALHQLGEFGVNFNHVTDYGLAAVHITASHNHPHLLKILLSNAADLNSVTEDDKGETAACIAAQRGHLEFIHKLAELDADLEKKDKQGMTPLALAIEAGHAHVVDFLKAHRSAVGMLRASSLDMNIKSYVKVLIKHESSCVLTQGLEKLFETGVLQGEHAQNCIGVIFDYNLDMALVFIEVFCILQAVGLLQSKYAASHIQAILETKNIKDLLYFVDLTYQHDLLFGEQAEKCLAMAVFYASTPKSFFYYIMGLLEKTGMLQHDQARNALQAVIWHQDLKGLAFVFRELRNADLLLLKYVYPILCYEPDALHQFSLVVTVLEEAGIHTEENISAIFQSDNREKLYSFFSNRALGFKSTVNEQVVFDQVISGSRGENQAAQLGLFAAETGVADSSKPRDETSGYKSASC